MTIPEIVVPHSPVLVVSAFVLVSTEEYAVAIAFVLAVLAVSYHGTFVFVSVCICQLVYSVQAARNRIGRVGLM
jgi:hypothetical protein